MPRVVEGPIGWAAAWRYDSGTSCRTRHLADYYPSFSPPRLPLFTVPGTMLSSSRSRIAALSTRSSRLVQPAYYSVTASRLSENPRPTSDPTPRKLKPDVSSTNAVPIDSIGARDAPLQELSETGERSPLLQAPNRATTWAASQLPRERAMTGPRFEQTIMEDQVSSSRSEML